MNWHRAHASIITRLVLLMVAIAAIGAVVRYVTVTHFLQGDLKELIAAQQLALARYVADDIDYKLTQRRQLLVNIAASVPEDLLHQPDKLRVWLKERHEYQPVFAAGLFIADLQGHSIADYPLQPDRVHKTYADRDYLQAALAGNAFIGRPVVGRVVNTPVLPMSAPIKSRNGTVRAVLVGVTPLAEPGFLDSFLKSRLGHTTGGFLLISPRDKLFVASSQPDMVLKPTPAPGVNLLHDRAMAGFRGTGLTINAKGVEELSAMVSIPSADWFVVARMPTSEVFAAVRRTQNFMIQSFVIAAPIFLLCLGLGLFWVFRPLFVAAEHANRMTLGKLPMESLPVVRNDEVGHLISAFNRLLTKLNTNQSELQRMAHHDTLTGLPNRRLLADRLRHTLAQAKRKGTQVALLFMDLDGFKIINDEQGHDVGDTVLQEISSRLLKCVREVDTLARVGGDEFVLLLSDFQGDASEGAQRVADKCIQALRAPMVIGPSSYTVGVSIGIALGHGEHTSDALLSAADSAMYQAKKMGRNQYIISSFGLLPEN